MSFITKLLTIVFITGVFTPQTWAIGPNLSFEGTLYDSVGNVVTDPSVTFTVKIADPTGTKVLLTETHVLDLSASNGKFSINIGTNSPTIADGYSFEDVFKAGVAFTTPGYTASTTDSRTIVANVQYGAVNETFAPVEITSAAFAQVAKVLEGNIDASQINQGGATSGQVLKYDGTNWTAGTDADNSLSVGTANKIMKTNAGATDLVDSNISDDGTNITLGSAVNIGGNASVSGNLNLNSSGASLNYHPDGTACTSGDILAWDATNSRWACGADDTGSDTSLNGVTVTASPATSGQVLKYDGTNWTAGTDATGAGGETNTASNQGTAGVGVFKVKNGADLEFKNINAASTKITISDDTTDNEVDIDIDESVLNISNMGGSITASRITNNTGEYLQYKPNNIACNDGENLKWDNTNNWWICGPVTLTAPATNVIPVSDGSDLVASAISDNGSTEIDIFGRLLDMNSQRVIGVADPSATQDAATKNYVDTVIQSINVSDIVSGSGDFLTYAPNGIACNPDQVLIYDGTNWICGPGLASGFSDGELLVWNSTNGEWVLESIGSSSGDVSGTIDNLIVDGLKGYPVNTPTSGEYLVFNGTSWGTQTPAGTGDFLADGSVSMTGSLDMAGQNIVNLNGPIGINNATPTADLHISNGTAAASLKLEGVSQPADLILDASGGYSAGISLVTDGNPAFIDFLPIGTSSFKLNATSADFKISTPFNQNAFVLRKSTGNVGIGAAPLGNSSLLIQKEDDTFVDLFTDDSYADGVLGSKVRFFSSRGSHITPANLAAYDPIGGLEFHGYIGGTHTYIGGIDVITSPSLDGSEMIFKTGNTGAALPAMKIDENGNLLPYSPDTNFLGDATYRWSQIHTDLIYTTGGSVQTSDKRYKKDISESILGKDFIMSLKPVSYKYKDRKNDKTHYGLLAQDLDEVLGDIEFAGLHYDEANDRYSLAYTELIAPMIKAFQEQDTEVQKLKNDNEQLKRELEELKQMIRSLSSK